MFKFQWCLGPFPECKLNTDASVRQGRAAGGGLLRDHEGKLVFAFYKEFGEADVLMAETLSLYHGLRLCQERGVRSPQVEVDSAVLVGLISSDALARWPLCNLLCRLRYLIRSLGASISHIFREANSTADRLAGLQLSSDMFFSSITQLPPIVRSSLSLDCCQYPSLRLHTVRE